MAMGGWEIRLALFRFVDPVPGEQQGRDAVHRSRPFGKMLIIADDPVESRLNGDEGRRGLGHFAQGHCAEQKVVRAEDPGDCRCNQDIGMGEHGESH